MIGQDIINTLQNHDYDFDKLMDLENFNLRLPIPESTKGTIDNYVKHGLEPGSFVKAVLSNDLNSAFGCADGINTICMRAIVAYVYNYIPNTCHGSPEIVRGWLDKFRGEE